MKTVYSTLQQKTFLILSVGFLVLSLGCKKKTLEYTIEGNIHDLGFNSNLEGAKVKIYSSGAGDDNFSATITTSADGNYTYTFPRENYTDITIEVSKNNYFEQKQVLSIESLSLKESNNYSFNLDSKAWVRIHFIGDGSKSLKFGTLQGYTGCDECCTGAEETIYNVTDLERLCLNKGNKTYKIYYDVIGSSEYGEVEVTTVPFEYTELLVDLN